MANSLHITKRVCLYEPFDMDKDSFIKIYSKSWDGLVIDVWHINGQRDYHQMVGYFITPEGNEVVLGRRDTPVLEVESWEFHSARRQFILDLLAWSLHGIVDDLDSQLSAADLETYRQTLPPLDPRSVSELHTLVVNDNLELFGKMVYWRIESKKLINGPFKQTVDFYVKEDNGMERQCRVIVPDTEQPFLKVGAHFEKHKTLIAETLGLDLRK